MASFGRKKKALGGSSLSAAKRSQTSESFKLLMEEEEERERFAKEFDEGQKKNGVSQVGGSPASKDTGPEPETSRPNPRVFLEVELRGPELLGRSGKVEASGRLEFELFADVAPKTAENFRCLCTGEKGRSLHLEDSIFHRIIPGFMAQGGDITDADGTGGRSIYGPSFADEKFVRKHEDRGALSMANSGPNTNNSQFFMLFKAAPHLNGKHVVFGKMLAKSGADALLRKIEDKGAKSGDVKGVVKIVASGQLNDEPLAPTAPAAAAAAKSREAAAAKSRRAATSREVEAAAAKSARAPAAKSERAAAAKSGRAAAASKEATAAAASGRGAA
eukprot:CAMPEP_0183525092 /NCGR_PEP_ID=MMETSP0371-20130417/20384_1 /TAXON_ID=268820 /ORGANISM="Peridinium aciculiferum, Strain PAER-2" /LENGTH=331 /DNA_ID=CAMNT_0025724287 /DNA_START=75 /DNA_END=1067 /DNA_ORIENTATION=-